MPAFDSCVPLIARLHERGRISTKVLLGPRIRKVEPRTEEFLRQSGIPYVNRSLLGLELFSLADFWRSDAILTHSDPVAFGGKFRPRDRYATGLKKPVIFNQHGMVQSGLHVQGADRARIWDYYAEKMLIWSELPDPSAPWLAPNVADKLSITGITKTNLLAPWPGLPELRAQFQAFDQTVLICHNFGFEVDRYSMQMFENAIAIWQEVAKARPNIAFVLRSHRGKRHADVEAKVEMLCRECPNIIRSERHHGLTKMATIHDVMSIADCVVSHPSTVLLDAAYANKPIAVINPLESGFGKLKTVDQLDDFLAFVDHPESLDKGSILRNLYGDLSTNLDKAARVVEERLEQI